MSKNKKKLLDDIEDIDEIEEDNETFDIDDDDDKEEDFDLDEDLEEGDEEAGDLDEEGADLDDLSDHDIDDIQQIINNSLNPQINEINNTDHYIYDNINKPHETTKYLSKYEKTRAIGERANMLSLGCLTTLDYVKLELDIDTLTPIEIALLELKHKVLPFIIKRVLPNKKEPVYVSINDLIDTNIDVNE